LAFDDLLGTFGDYGDLTVIVVTVTLGTGMASGGDAVASGFVGEVAANLFNALPDGGEEDGFFIFAKALEMALGSFGEKEAPAAGYLEALVDEFVLICVSDEAEVDLRLPYAFAVLVTIESAVAAVDGSCSFGAEGRFPDEFPGDGYGEFELLPETGEEAGAVVVGSTDEGDTTVAILVGPAKGRRVVDGGLVGSLYLDDIAGSAAAIVGDILVALNDVKIVVRDVFHVETPAGILACAEGIVDHITNSGDSHGSHAIECGGAHPEELISPEEIGLFGCGDTEEIAVETADRGTCGKTEDDLVEERVVGHVLVRIEGDEQMAEPLQCPEAIERRVVRGETCSVKNLHSSLIIAEASQKQQRQSSSKGLHILVVGAEEGNDLFGVNDAYEMLFLVNDRERAQVVFIEELGYLATVGVCIAAYEMAVRKV